jgi:hypothetical protein
LHPQVLHSVAHCALRALKARGELLAGEAIGCAAMVFVKQLAYCVG